MEKVHSFLPTSQQVLRSMIQGIMESYENPWDILAELSQNAMDAIHKGSPPKGHIWLRINALKGKIRFKDNGTGIHPDELTDLFVPYGSNKRSDPDSIGEKGVGLKFVIFSTNDFRLVSHHSEGSFEVRVKGAADWLRSDDESAQISFKSKSIGNDKNEHGVTVSLMIADNEHHLFGLDIEQLQSLLLTKTAVGSTAHIWSDEGETGENTDIELQVINLAGEKEIIEFECDYKLPTKDIKKILSITEYNDWKIEGERSEEAKRRKFKNAIIYNVETVKRTGREIKVWSCMMPSRTQWALNAEKDKLIDSSEIDDFNVEDHFYAHHSGVFLSTKDMPTGVAIDLRATGEAGYTQNFFMLIEDRSLKFDIGRKGIPARTKGLLRDIAQNEFKKYLKFKRFIRGEGVKNNAVFEREKLFEEIKALPDLKSDSSAFVKRPSNQEATVAAMFYEKLGQKHFAGFEPYVSGYRDRYDLTGRYGGKNLILEFKYDLAGLFADYSIHRKLFDEMNIVVVWHIDDKDHAKAKDRLIEIEPIEEDDDERLFPLTQYRLTLDTVSPVEVLVMSKLLEAD